MFLVQQRLPSGLQVLCRLISLFLDLDDPFAALEAARRASKHADALVRDGLLNLFAEWASQAEDPKQFIQLPFTIQVRLWKIVYHQSACCDHQRESVQSLGVTQHCMTYRKKNSSELATQTSGRRYKLRQLQGMHSGDQRLAQAGSPHLLSQQDQQKCTYQPPWPKMVCCFI